MSTVFYGFKVRSEHHLREQLIKLATMAMELEYCEQGVDIQVFRTSSGILYRVLEAGYGLQNKMWEDASFESFGYDDRTDILENDNKSLSIVEEIDTFIAGASYEVLVLREPEKT